MAAKNIEQRLAALEAEVAELKANGRKDPTGRAWVDAITGAFENDPIHEEAMRLGREYRESLRPKPRRAKREKPRPDANP